jgi:mRNA-degrading endonuclease RelE of RelBE toxin-antitoxin system
MFDIQFSSEGEEDLSWFRKSEQQLILDQIKARLGDQADVETRNRKRLKPGHLTEWELRIGDIRVFYDVDADAPFVTIAAIGYKKRNRLFFRGREFGR